MVRPFLVLVVGMVLAPAIALGQQPAPVDIVEVSGPLDGRAIDFAIDAITDTDAQLVVLKLNSPGAISGDITELLDLVADPPVPVAVWVGPDPAEAHGGAAQLLAVSAIGAAAPGVKVGYLWPTVAGDRSEPVDSLMVAYPDVSAELFTERVEVTEPIEGIVDLVVPSIGQLVTGVDGMSLDVNGEETTLQTAVEEIDEDGVTVLRPVAETRFRSPGLLTTMLRLAVNPDVAFFFLVAGIAIAVFEFYAAGAGIMAAVAVLSLLIAGYGLIELPMRWWALGATLLGLGLYTADFQRNDLGWRSLAGTVLLVTGGWWFIDASPQISSSWWVVLLVVLFAALFFGIGMTAVVRARYSTTTIGREQLVGRRGTAEDDLRPEGVIVVDGARWQARAHRAAGIASGDEVEVVAVSGVTLEVDPVDR
jgi:membrane-bound serine protease (ClpP class)